VPNHCQSVACGEASPFNHICSTLVELMGVKSAEGNFRARALNLKRGDESFHWQKDDGAVGLTIEASMIRPIS
jgi:hypothetical protein